MLKKNYSLKSTRPCRLELLPLRSNYCTPPTATTEIPAESCSNCSTASLSAIIYAIILLANFPHPVGGGSDDEGGTALDFWISWWWVFALLGLVVITVLLVLCFCYCDSKVLKPMRERRRLRSHGIPTAPSQLPFSDPETGSRLSTPHGSCVLDFYQQQQQQQQQQYQQHQQKQQSYLVGGQKPPSYRMIELQEKQQQEPWQLGIDQRMVMIAQQQQARKEQESSWGITIGF